MVGRAQCENPAHPARSPAPDPPCPSHQPPHAVRHDHGRAAGRLLDPLHRAFDLVNVVIYRGERRLQGDRHERNPKGMAAPHPGAPNAPIAEEAVDEHEARFPRWAGEPVGPSMAEKRLRPAEHCHRGPDLQRPGADPQDGRQPGGGITAVGKGHPDELDRQHPGGAADQQGTWQQRPGRTSWGANPTPPRSQEDRQRQEQPTL